MTTDISTFERTRREAPRTASPFGLSLALGVLMLNVSAVAQRPHVLATSPPHKNESDSSWR